MKTNIQNNFKRVFAFLKLNTQKRELPLLVALALLISCAAGSFIPVQAADGAIVDFSSDTTRGTPTTSLHYAFYYELYSTEAGDKFYSILTNLPAGCVLITGYGSTSSTYYGVFFDDNGTLVLGQFARPGYSVTVSYLGVHSLSELVCLNSWQCNINSYPVFFDYELAVTYSHTTDVVWIYNGSTSYFYYSKLSSGEVTATSNTSDISVSGSLSSQDYFYYPLRSSYMIFHTEYQHITVSEDTEQSSSRIDVYNYRTSPYYAGSFQGFNCSVDGVALNAEEIVEQISWSVSGNTSVNTTINESGILTIGPNEAASALTVTAVLKEDSSVTGSMSVAVTPLPDPDELYLMPDQTVYEAGQPYSVTYYLAFADGTEFDYDDFSWAIDTADTAVSINQAGVLSITSASVVGSFKLTVSYGWSDAPLKTAYIQLVDPDSSSGGDSSGGSSSGDTSTEIDPTDEKLDDIISGGEAGEELGGASDELDNKNEELGGTMDEYENAQSQLPTTPNDVSDIINQDDLNASIDVMTGLLDWDNSGLAMMYVPMASVLGIAALCYIVFGKKG